MRFEIYDELCKHRTPLDNATYITNWRFKDEDEYKAFADHIQFKNGQYLKCCKGDFEKTKEVAERMNKIRKTNDPRMNYNTGNIYAVVNGVAYIPEMINMRNGFRENIEYEFSITSDPRYAVENTMLAIKDVIFNPPATIVFWGDGSKTVVKCQDGEEFDPEKGLAIAFFKKMHGNKGHYFEEIKKWTHKYAMSLFKDEVHTMKDEQIEEVIEAGMSKPTDTVWVLFYARADRGEDEGYTQHPVVYKHKSSAVRAAKRLISKLPNGVDYEWFVDEK